MFIPTQNTIASQINILTFAIYCLCVRRNINNNNTNKKEEERKKKETPVCHLYSILMSMSWLKLLTSMLHPVAILRFKLRMFENFAFCGIPKIIIKIIKNNQYHYIKKIHNLIECRVIPSCETSSTSKCFYYVEHNDESII